MAAEPEATTDGRFESRLSRSSLTGYRPEVLSAARVLVCGAGALGQNTIQNLVLSGVREIRIVDADRFEDHNLTRSPLQARGAPLAGGSRSKAEVVAGESARIATHPEAVVSWADAWVEDLGAALFEDVDMIVGCVDSLASRLYLNRASLVHRIPHVTAGFSGPELSLAVFPRADAVEACWTCGAVPVDDPFSCRQAARVAGEQQIIPAIQTGAAVLGGLQAEAVIGLLHGWETEPRRTFLDIRTLSAYSSPAPPDPVCAEGHLHRYRPIATDTDTDQTLDDLLAGVDLEGGIVHLEDPYVHDASCVRCEHTVRVEAPLRRWRPDPLCDRCGGTWPRLAIPDTPEVTVRILPGAPCRHLTLRQLGFAAGDRVITTSAGTTYAIRLGGSITSTFRAAAWPSPDQPSAPHVPRASGA